MAGNTGKNHRDGSVTGRTQLTNPKTGLATKRDTGTGKFIAVKTGGGDFKGVAREIDKRRK